MNHSYNLWNTIATNNLDTIVDYVITDGTVKSISYDTRLLNCIDWNTQGLSVLDFGCGVGRNIIPLAIKFPSVKFYGYDTTNMLKNIPKYCAAAYDKDVDTIPNIRTTDSWTKIKSIKYHYAYATLVFQHIHEKEISRYIDDLKMICNYLLIYGRRFNDDIGNDGKHKNTWKILEDKGLTPINADDIKYAIDGDSEEHTGFCVYKFL